MKKVTISAFIVFALLFSAFAQENASENDIQDWRFGIKAQPSISWFNSNNKQFDHDKVKLNFGYGLTIEKRIFNSGTTVLATGFIINDFGGTYDYTGKDKNVLFKNENDSIIFTSRKLMLRYVEIPVALKFRTPEINYLTYFAHFGLDIGFRVRARSDDSFLDIRTNKSGVYADEVVTDDVNFMKMGLNLGIGAEYSLAGSTSLVIGLSYINGFTNIVRKQPEMIRYDDGSRVTKVLFGHTVNLSVGILF